MKQELKEAIGHFNSIIGINEVVAEYHARTSSINKLIDTVGKETNRAGTLIYSAPLNIVLKVAGSKNSFVYDLKINKLEIRYFLNKKRDDQFYGFRLDLTLLSNDKHKGAHYTNNIMNSFPIAATKDYNEFYIVCDGKFQEIRDRNDHCVIFSESDFDKVINLCEGFIAEFNSHIKGQEKLLSHLTVK